MDVVARMMHIRFTSSPARVPYAGDRATVLCNNTHPKVRQFSARLASTIIANSITYSIQHRESHVHRLDLNRSGLGDSGCVQLFRFLCSPCGKKYRNSITEIYLTSCQLGEQGLRAISAYLRGNEVLRELCLSGNPLTKDPATVAMFTSALNSSHVCTLHLIHNGNLSDDFVTLFLPQLTSPYLRHLDMQALAMTRISVPVIVDYVSSTKCRLERLQCNANGLTLSGAREIVDAIERHNHSLWKVNLDDLHIDSAHHDNDERMHAWQEGWHVLNSISSRNTGTRKATREEALSLLVYARALFLRSKSHKRVSSNGQNSTKEFQSAKVSPFFDLPPELQTNIIGLLAPMLSHKQRVRICDYAADSSTLPRLDFVGTEMSRRRFSGLARYAGNFKRSPRAPPVILSVKGTSTNTVEEVEEDSRAPEGTWRPCAWWKCACKGTARHSCRALRRWKKEMRDIWLTRLGCDVYEPALWR